MMLLSSVVYVDGVLICQDCVKCQYLGVYIAKDENTEAVTVL